MGVIGQRIARKEDQRFLTGKGRYTDDMNRRGQAHAYIVRSQIAHGKLKSVDTSDAEKAPGVIAVLTSKDTAHLGGLPCGWQVHSKDGSPMVEPKWPVLAEDKVFYCGQSIAVVVAETKEQAKAAGKLIHADIEELTPIGTLEQAVGGAGIEIHDGTKDNVAYDWHIGEKDPVDEAFKNAKHVIELDIRNQRVVPNAMEPRAAIGEYDSAMDHYTLITTSQNPHLIRLLLGAFVMQVPEHKIRVLAPDVGGGFGSKIFHYAEEVLVVAASKMIGRPVKWTAERTESFLTDAHGRDHISRARLAMDGDGKFLGLHVQTEANMGAFLSTFAPAVPTYLYATLLAGVYTTPAIYAEVKARFTNTTPVDAYRGAGRPEAAYLLERLVEEAARQTGIDRVELRRKNMIKKDQFPYQTPVALEYDTGDFEACLDLALEKIDYAGFEKRREDSKSRGKVRGLGISTYVEACGIAPSALAGALGARAGLYESSTIRVHPTGSVTVFTGTHSHGQGHETTFAQIVADHFGIEVDQVNLEHGDSAQSAFGMGTYGSRSLPVGGSAIVKAADKIIEKGRKIAAHMLEASADDIEFENGQFKVKGTDRAKAFGEVAFAAYVPHDYPIEEVEPGLEETAFYDPKNFTFPGGCHVVEVEVDPETGVVEVCNVAVADDVGRVINPMIVDGQIHGGLAQGIGQALMEQAVYDDHGQLLTGSYMNYQMPRAADFPMFNVGNHVTPCTHNPLGSKGVGEVGAIGVPPAVINAVLDAIREFGVKDITMPATPQKVWKAINQAQASA